MTSKRIRSDSYDDRHSDSSASRVDVRSSCDRIIFRVTFARVESLETFCYIVCNTTASQIPRFCPTNKSFPRRINSDSTCCLERIQLSRARRILLGSVPRLNYTVLKVLKVANLMLEEFLVGVVNYLRETI